MNDSIFRTNFFDQHHGGGPLPDITVVSSNTVDLDQPGNHLTTDLDRRIEEIDESLDSLEVEMQDLIEELDQVRMTLATMSGEKVGLENAREMMVELLSGATIIKMAS